VNHVLRVVRVVVVLGALAALGYFGYREYEANPQALEQALVAVRLMRPTPTVAGIQASGTLEARTAEVMTQVPGRVLRVTVDEGDEVREGQVVVELDHSLVDRQLAVAQAEIALAEAQLALVKAGPRPEQVAQAEAQVRAAEAALRAARQGLADAQALRDTAQDVEPEIVQAETNLARAQHLRDAALAQAQAADLALQMWGRVVKSLEAGVDVTLPGGIKQHFPTPREKLDWAYEQWNVASQQAWQAWAAYREAEAGVKAAQEAVDAARARREDPARDVPVAQAQAGVWEAEEGVQVAKAALSALEEGVNDEKIAAAEANVGRAKAAYERVARQRDFYAVRAPVSGRVVSRSIEEGEVAAPGVSLLEIADLRTLRLTLYVLETDLGAVRLGQSVSISVDAFPGREFMGTVVRIAGEAEFTPKNVQTPDERVNLVYAVEVSVPNPKGLLKPGMPADGIIHTE